MDDRYTDRVRLSLALAGTSAKDRRATRIESEHLLHGLLLEASGEAARLLRRLGVHPTSLCIELEEVLAPAPRLPLGEEAECVMARALESCELVGETRAGTADILVGLLEETSGVAPRILREAGLTPEAVRREMLALRRGRPGPDGSRERPLPRVLCTARLGLTGLDEVISLRSREETLGSLAGRVRGRHEDLLTSYLTLTVGTEVLPSEIEVRFYSRAGPAVCLDADRQVLTVGGAEEVGLHWTARWRS